MELVPVAFATVLVALAGPLGITLGWWLGRRGEHERQLRDERRSAYVAFVHAAIRFRNGTDADRVERREERWAALSEIVLVAPPPVVEAASYLVATGERLLEPDIARDDRIAVFQAMWERNGDFTRLARGDLRVGDTDPFDGMQPLIGERVDFHPPASR